MLLTNPLACPETVQQTGQKHFRGEIKNQSTGFDIEQQLSASGRGCMSVDTVGNKRHEGVREVWEGDNWSDGYGKYRDRRGTGCMGKGPNHPTNHICLPENCHPPSPPHARHQSPIPSHPETLSSSPPTASLTPQKRSTTSTRNRTHTFCSEL